MTLFYDSFTTRLGEFSLAVDSAGALAATAFGSLESLQRRVAQRPVTHDNRRTASAREQILAYLAGQRRTFDLPLAPRGTPFQQRVWSALRQIPFGETRSYGSLAVSLGVPGASRAVGRANATNPICLVIPCHRVIGADGSLTGFAFGEEVKRRLLDLEGALRPTAPCDF